jgi:hypothetical protein
MLGGTEGLATDHPHVTRQRKWDVRVARQTSGAYVIARAIVERESTMSVEDAVAKNLHWFPGLTDDRNAESFRKACGDVRAEIDAFKVRAEETHALELSARAALWENGVRPRAIAHLTKLSADVPFEESDAFRVYVVRLVRRFYGRLSDPLRDALCRAVYERLSRPKDDDAAARSDAHRIWGPKPSP